VAVITKIQVKHGLKASSSKWLPVEAGGLSNIT